MRDILLRQSPKRILEDYARKNGFTNILHFTDDGVRGTTFKRPGLDAMADEIRAGDVATVIVKKQSRIGRDVVEVGLLKRTFDEATATGKLPDKHFNRLLAEYDEEQSEKEEHSQALAQARYEKRKQERWEFTARKRAGLLTPEEQAEEGRRLERNRAYQKKQRDKKKASQPEKPHKRTLEKLAKLDRAEAGRTVTAYGDSINDYYMLKQAEHGYLVTKSDGRISRSLNGKDLGGIKFV